MFFLMIIKVVLSTQKKWRKQKFLLIDWLIYLFIYLFIYFAYLQYNLSISLYDLDLSLPF